MSKLIIPRHIETCENDMYSLFPDHRRAHLEATKGKIRVSRFNKSSTIRIHRKRK